MIQPATDIAWCRAELSRLARGADVDAGPAEVAAYLRAQGFAGADDYYAVSNSSLESVLRRRRGIPISLAMVVVGVGEALGLTATGINFPRHFLVTLGDQLIDPFSMTAIERADCREWLEGSNVPEHAAFRPASALDVIMRMLNNLRMLAQSSNDHARALELSEYQLAVASDPFIVHVARIDSWLALGATEMARRELDLAIRLAPSAATAAQLEERRQQLAGLRPTLH